MKARDILYNDLFQMNSWLVTFCGLLYVFVYSYNILFCVKIDEFILRTFCIYFDFYKIDL